MKQTLLLMIAPALWACSTWGAAFEIDIDLSADSLRILESGRPGKAADCNSRGLREMDNGRLQEAKTLFEQATALSPADPDPANNLGVVLSRLGRPNEALSHWNRVLAKNPNYAPAGYNLALFHYGRGHLDSAAFWIDKSYARNPETPLIALLKGLIAYHTRRMAEAALAFEQVNKTQPLNGDAYAYLALSYTEMGYPQKASKAIEAGLRKAGRSPLLLQLAAKERYDRGEYAAALSLLEKATEQNARIEYFKGLCANELGRFSAAENHFRFALKTDSVSSEIWLALGHSLFAQKKWKEAEDSYRRALSLSPGDVDIQSNLASALFAQGSYKDALGFWKGLEDRTDNPLIYTAIGKSHFLLKEWSAAAPYFERTLAIRKDYETMDLLAICRFRLGRVIEARGLWNELRRNAGGAYSSSEVFFNDFNSQEEIRKALESYAKNRPADPEEAFYQAVRISRLHSLLGEHGKAVSAVEPFAPKQPAVVLPLLSSYHRQAGDLASALSHLEALEKVRPDYRRIKAMKGDLLTELGRYGEALSELRAERNPDALTFYQIGYCLDEFGRLRESEEAFRKSAEMDPTKAAPKALLAYVIRKQDSTRSGEARAFWTEAARLDSGNAEVASNIGLTYYENGDYTNALRFAQRAVDLAPRQAGFRVQLGNVLFKMNRHDEALTQYRSVIAEKGPYRCGALGNMASVFAAQGRHETLLSELRPFIETCDSLLESMFLALRHLKQYDRAAFYFSRIPEPRRKAGNLYQISGEIGYERKEYDRAIADLSKADASPAKHFYLAQCYLKKDNAISAIDHASRFKETAPKEQQYEADMLLGLSHMAGHDFPHAIESFQNAMRRDPRNAGGPMNLAIAFYYAGQHDKGRPMYEKSIELNPACWPPNSPIAQFYKEGRQTTNPSISTGTDRDSLYNQAVEFHKQEKLDSAENLYRRVLSLDSSMANAWSNLGLIYQTNGNSLLAEESFIRAIASDSLLAEAYYNLALSYWNEESSEKALETLGRGLLHCPNDNDLLNLQKTFRKKAKKTPSR